MRPATHWVAIRPLLCWVAAFVPVSSFAQQPPDIGIAPVALTQQAYIFDTAEQHKIRVVVVAKGLSHPFSLAFLPSGDALISERGAQLRIVHNATAGHGQRPALDPKAISGVPQVTPPYRGGGLHDIALHPQFAANQLIYFSYNKAAGIDPQAPPAARQRSAVALMRAKFDGKAFRDVEELFVGEASGGSGSRIAFGADGMIYMTTGAPFSDAASKLSSVYGKVLRLQEDGRAPKDNPFVDRDGAKPEIFSIGHRDQLGLAIHPQTGAVFAAEHGPNGGDKVNLILPGRNYGWPRYSFGRNYDGTRISQLPLDVGIEPPAIVWLPSIAPTGLTFYSGDRFPAWNGNLFIGSARRGEIPHTGGLERVVFNDKFEELRRETLLTDLHQRIRDVRQGPDGLIYVLTDEDDGALLRIEPAGS